MAIKISISVRITVYSALMLFENQSITALDGMMMSIYADTSLFALGLAVEKLP